MTRNRRHSTNLIPRGGLARFLAIAIAICYLMQPLSGTVKMAMHSITHFMAKPTQVISHDTTPDGSLGSLHRYGAHEYANTDHDHNVLEFLDSLLTGETGETGNEQSIVEIFKVEKHIVQQSRLAEYRSQSPTIASFELKVQHTRSGHLWDLIRPPATT